jgi:recombination protein RecT
MDNRLELVRQVVAHTKPQFEELAKIHGVLNYKEEASFALQILDQSDYICKIAKANPDSLKRAILNVAIIGLSLNPYKREAYLIPRKNQICMDISYIGYINLYLQIGAIKFAIAELVYANDRFKWKGPTARPIHEADIFQDRGTMMGGYVLAQTPAGDWIVTYMPLDDIHKRRDRSESYKANSGPWKSDYIAMVKKTLLRNARTSWPAAVSDRIAAAERVVEEADPLLLAPSPEIESVERQDLFLGIKTACEILGTAEATYLRHAITSTGRDLKRIEDMTTHELKTQLVGLNQLVDLKNSEGK